MLDSLLLRRSILSLIGICPVWLVTVARADVLMVPSQFPTIQDAIAAAEVGDEIVVSPGTYSELLDLLGKGLTIRSSGGAAATIISGSFAGGPVVLADAINGVLRLEGLTIADGRAVGGQPGAGLRVVDSTVILEDCVLSGHGAIDTTGSALAIDGGAVVLDGCTLTLNTAETSLNPGLFGGTIHVIDGSLTATDSDFFNNLTQSVSGGAIGAEGASTVTLTGCTFDSVQTLTSASFSGFAGAVVVRGSTSLSIEDCSFTNNILFGGGSGSCVSVQSGNAGTVSIIDSTFSSNSGLRSVILSGGGTPTVRGCLFENNNPGGGLALTSGTLTLSDTTFVDNRAPTGGGLDVAGSSARVFATDCAFIDNESDGLGVAFGGGAAIRFSLAGDGSVLTRCRFEGNRNTDNLADGGAIRIRRTVVSFVDCEFVENVAVNNVGGAVHVENVSTTRRTITFQGCTFERNEATGTVGPEGFAGALHSLDPVDFVVEDCTFVDNIVAAERDGGHIYTTGQASLTVRRSTFVGGNAKDGGAIYSRGSGGLVVEDSTFSGARGNAQANGAGGDGGAINHGGSGPATIIRSAFVDCSAKNGGGVFVAGGSAMLLDGVRFSNCDAIANNSSSGNGGGLNIQPSASLSIRNLILENCSAREGGGAVLNSGAASVVNALVVGNSATANAGGLRINRDTRLVHATVINNVSEGIRFGSGSTATASLIASSIIRGNTTAQIAGGTPPVRQANIEGGFAGSGVIDLAPIFVDAGARDYRLAAGSAGIDAGSGPDLPVDVLTDLAGEPRRVNDSLTPDTGTGSAPMADHGAYEYQAPFVACEPDLNDDGLLDFFDLLIFLADFSGQSGVGDWNNDGVFDFFDITAYLSEFSAGCP